MNAITGNDLDSRDGTFAKAQLLLLPNANWEARLIYALRAQSRRRLRARRSRARSALTPFRVARDFEGFTNRDINNTTFNVRGTGQNFAIESTTGFVKWNTEDATDLDYSPLPLATRNNRGRGPAVHAGGPHRARPTNAPIALGSTMMLKWQAGVEYFNQAYDQDAVNTLSAFVLSPQVAVPGGDALAGSRRSTAPASACSARGTLTFNDKADLTAGLRFDHESSDALLQHVLRAGDRAGERRDGRAVVLRRVAAVRVRLSRHAASTTSTRPRRAATRPAASIRRRCPAARPTAKSTRGTSRAASSRRWPAARCRRTRRCSSSTGTICS